MHINLQSFKEGLFWKSNIAADTVIGKMFAASSWKAWQRREQDKEDKP